MAHPHLQPIPNADLTKDWTGIEDWARDVTIQARALDTLQNCYDALHFPPHGPGWLLANEVSAWLSRTLSADDLRAFATWSNGQKRDQTVRTQDFYASILQRWGAAFNIPPDSQKFQHIVYNIVKLKISTLTRSGRRRRARPDATEPALPLVPAAAPAARAQREPEADLEIEFVAADGDLLGSAFVRFLRRDDVKASNACVETIDLAKFLDHIEEECGVDANTLLLKHYYPDIPALHNRIIRPKQSTLVTEVWRAYSHGDRNGLIRVQLEPKQDAATLPASKRPGSPGLVPDPKRQRAEYVSYSSLIPY
jgi:hypothetical protein